MKFTKTSRSHSLLENYLKAKSTETVQVIQYSFNTMNIHTGSQKGCSNFALLTLCIFHFFLNQHGPQLLKENASLNVNAARLTTLLSSSLFFATGPHTPEERLTVLSFPVHCSHRNKTPWFTTKKTAPGPAWSAARSVAEARRAEPARHPSAPGGRESRASPAAPSARPGGQPATLPSCKGPPLSRGDHPPVPRQAATAEGQRDVPGNAAACEKGEEAPSQPLGPVPATAGAAAPWGGEDPPRGNRPPRGAAGAGGGGEPPVPPLRMKWRRPRPYRYLLVRHPGRLVQAEGAAGRAVLGHHAQPAGRAHQLLGVAGLAARHLLPPHHHPNPPPLPLKLRHRYSLPRLGTGTAATQWPRGPFGTGTAKGQWKAGSRRSRRTRSRRPIEHWLRTSQPIPSGLGFKAVVLFLPHPFWALEAHAQRELLPPSSTPATRKRRASVPQSRPRIPRPRKRDSQSASRAAQGEGSAGVGPAEDPWLLRWTPLSSAAPRPAPRKRSLPQRKASRPLPEQCPAIGCPAGAVALRSLDWPPPSDVAGKLLADWLRPLAAALAGGGS